MRQRFARVCDYASLISLAAVIFFIPISKAAIEISFAFAYLFFVLKKIAHPDFSFLRHKVFLWVGLFFVLCALSLAVHHAYLEKGLKSLFFKWGEGIFIFIFFADAITTPRRLWAMLAVFLAGGALAGTNGFLQIFTGTDFIRHKALVVRAGYEYPFLTASFNHYNDFAAYLGFVLMVALSFWLYESLKKSWRVLLLVLVGLMTTCLMLTFSRGAWVGAVAALLILAAMVRQRRALYPFVTLVCIGLLFSPLLKSRIGGTFTSTGDAGRFLLWREALAMIKAHPFFGIGLGTFMDYLNQYNPRLGAQYAHNCYLQIAAETGIASLAAFVGFLWVLLAGAVKAFMKNRDYIMLGLFCGVCGFLVHSFFDTQLYSLQLATLFWAAAGMLCAASRMPSADNFDKVSILCYK